MYPHSVGVGVLHQPRHLLRGVGGGAAGPETRSAYVEGVGAEIHGGLSGGVVACRSQQFYFP